MLAFTRFKYFGFLGRYAVDRVDIWGLLKCKGWDAYTYILHEMKGKIKISGPSGTR